MISLSDARAIIASSIQPLRPVRADLSTALGRVLREAVAASEDFPAFDRSAMDGYVIASDDRSDRYRVIAEIQPGEAPTITIRNGECARIFTGAQIPDGGAQVIMQEDVQREGEWIIPTRRTDATHVRRRGEDAKAGDVLLQPGRRLLPGDVSLLAQLGCTHPAVSPAPRVLHFATGNELVAPEAALRPGKIRDSNSSLIGSLLAQRGAQLIEQQRCEDDPQLLKGGILGQPVEAWDLLLISGGASVGDYDFGRRTLVELGFDIRFERISLRPGKPLIFGVRDQQAAFVIPGNPVSHFVTFHTAIRAALDCMESTPPAWPLVNVTLGEPLPANRDLRETYWPARIVVEDGRVTAYPLTWQSSGDLCGLAGANGLFQLRPEAGPLGRGEQAQCLMLDVP